MPSSSRRPASAPWMISSKLFERWLISITDMPRPGSDNICAPASSKTGSGMIAGPALKLKIRSVMIVCLGSICGLGMRHFFRLDVVVEFFAREQFQFDGRFPETDFLFERVLRNPGRVVVTDVRIQRRHQHQRVAQVCIDLFAIDRHSVDAVVDETVTRIMDQ